MFANKMRYKSEYGATLIGEIGKLFRSEKCGKIISLAIDLRIIDYFKLRIDDGYKFKSGMNQVAILMNSIDIFMNNLKLNIFIKEKYTKKAARKLLHERVRLLAIPYVFYKIDKEYSKDFLKEFIFSMSSNDYVNEYMKVFEVLTERKPDDPISNSSVIESIVDQMNFDDFRFQLNLIYYASFVQNGYEIAEFIDYYISNGKSHYYEYMAKSLNL
jgi:hypothetical protein